MGGIRDKPPPHLLNGLQAVGELVELHGQLGHLVLALDLDAVVVLALPHRADTTQQSGGIAGESLGQNEGSHQSHHTDHHGDVPQGGLDGQQHLRLLRVVFIEVHRPQGDTTVHRGDGHTGAERPLPILGPAHVLPPQGLDHLGGDGIVSGALFQGGAVIEDESGLVGHQHPGALHVVQQLHGLGHAVLGEHLRHRQGAADGQGLPLQRGLLG